MGACVITLSTSALTHQLDSIRMISGSIQFSNSYAPGGDTWTASQFGLIYVEDLKLESGQTINQAQIASGGKSGTMQAWWTGMNGAAWEEVTAGTNLPGTYHFQAWGW